MSSKSKFIECSRNASRSSIPNSSMTLSMISSLNLIAGASSTTSSSADVSSDSSTTSSSGASVGASSSSDSSSSPKCAPWNRLSASASISPSPLISKETSRRSPLPTTGSFQVISIPSSVSFVVISTSVRFSPPAPRTCQSLISKLEGMTSLMKTSCNAVSPLFSKRMRTS